MTDAAKLLGVTRQALNNVVNEKAGISPEMAIRRSKAFGSTPHTWVQMQAAFDLALALKNEGKINVQRYSPMRVAGAFATPPDLPTVLLSSSLT